MITINFQRQLDLCVSLHWTRFFPVWDSPPVYNSDLLQHLGSQVMTVEGQSNKQEKIKTLPSQVAQATSRCAAENDPRACSSFCDCKENAWGLTSVSITHNIISPYQYQCWLIDKSSYLFNVAKVRLASISVYIAAVCLCCHLLRIVPTFWEVLEVV